MAKTFLLPQQGGFYKANLHGHSTITDGHLTPEEFKAAYKQRGYSVAAITDHNAYRFHAHLNQEGADGFVCLAAAEYNINTAEDGPRRLGNRSGTYHFNAYDTTPHTRAAGFAPPLPPAGIYGSLPKINAWLGQMRQNGFLCCYNHPYWSLHNAAHYAGLRHLFAMEIYNHGCEVEGLNGFAPQVYDEMLAAGQQIFPLATDDNHNDFSFQHPSSDSFGGFIMLKLPALTYQNVVTALRQGHFYASTGPQIQELFTEGSLLTVCCDPLEKIYVKSAGRRHLCALAQPGSLLTRAQFDLSDFDRPFRLEGRDSHGRRVYTRAYE